MPRAGKRTLEVLNLVLPASPILIVIASEFSPSYRAEKLTTESRRTYCTKATQHHAIGMSISGWTVAGGRAEMTTIWKNILPKAARRRKETTGHG